MLGSVLRLLRRYPMLCLPVLCADLLRLLLMFAKLLLLLALTHFWPKPQAAITAGSDWGGPVRSGLVPTMFVIANLLQIVQYAAWFVAFLLIGASLRERRNGITVSWRRAWLFVKKRKRTVVLFSLGTVVLIMGLQRLLLALHIYLALAPREIGTAIEAHYHWSAFVIALPLCSLLAAFALRFLPNGQRANIDDHTYAAFYAILAVFVSHILMEAVWNRRLRPPLSGPYGLQLLLSFLTALPYVPLFVSLGLLVLRREEQP